MAGTATVPAAPPVPQDTPSCTTSEIAGLVEAMRAHATQAGCQGAYNDRQNQLFGRRCQLTIGPLYFDPKDGIFHLKHRAGRASGCHMIQNTKKSFYAAGPDGVVNEYFYDSYEGWYIRSYYHGFRQNYTAEASMKYCQCPMGLRMNTASFHEVLRGLSAPRPSK